MEIMRENAVVKNQGTKQREQRTLGDCWQWKEPTGSVLEETLAVSVTISISVQKQRSRILLRALLRGRMREMHREPEVPEARVQWKNVSIALQGLHQKEFAPIHSVKSGTLQNACSTRPRVVADLVKSALSPTSG